MQTRDIIVIGASAGGVEALISLAAGLPADFPAAVVVVLHLPMDATSYLPDILDRAGPLPAETATDGAMIRPGRIYVAPPNRHVLLEDGHLRLAVTPRINNVRPSIDVLFRSAARTYADRVIGVVLSGTLNDGTLGLDAIKARGGTVVIQDPQDARFPGMPRNVLDRVDVDYVLPVAQIPPLLRTLTAEPHRNGAQHEESGIVDREPIRTDASNVTSPAPHEKQGNAASGFTCPSCHGSVWELDDGGLPRIECRVGHAFSIDAFLGEQAAALEDAIWSAINALEERAMTLRRFASRFARSERRQASYLEEAETLTRQAALLREGLVRVVQADSSASA